MKLCHKLKSEKKKLQIDRFRYEKSLILGSLFRLGFSPNALPDSGLERRSRSLSSKDTPKLAIVVYMRSKLSTMQKERKAVAPISLRPKLPDSSEFKIPALSTMKQMSAPSITCIACHKHYRRPNRHQSQNISQQSLCNLQKNSPIAQFWSDPTTHTHTETLLKFLIVSVILCAFSFPN